MAISSCKWIWKSEHLAKENEIVLLGLDNLQFIGGAGHIASPNKIKVLLGKENWSMYVEDGRGGGLAERGGCYPQANDIDYYSLWEFFSV